MTETSRRLSSHELSVWELSSVLFDPTDARSGSVDEGRVRKESLAKFWTNLVQDSVTRSLEHAHSHEEKALAFLSGHKVAEACKALLDNRNFKLATLVSLIGTSDSAKKDMKEQIKGWHDAKMLSEFTEAIRTIYELLSGNVIAS